MDEPENSMQSSTKLGSFWESMSPSHRRVTVVVGGTACLFLAIGLITATENTTPDTIRDSVKRSVLTAMDTRSIGIDALNAKVQSIQADNGKLRQQLNSVNRELTDIKRRRGNDPDLTRQFGKLEKQLQNLTDKSKALGWEVEDIKEGHYPTPAQTPQPVSVAQLDQLELQKKPVSPARLNNKKALVGGVPPLTHDPSHYFKTDPVKPVPATVTTNPPDLNTDVPNGGLQIFTVESVAQSLDAQDDGRVLFLPAGSIVSGALLNGLDAGTGQGARTDPYPVLLRIQQDAILPNHFRADVKECFALLSGYGDLSSERAYLRGETFSCITNRGDAIEVKFPAYAVGEDGKAGIRGRVVHKAGALLAKTALAGLAAGIAEAFDTSPVPILQTGDVNRNRSFQDNFSSDAARHGLSSGASAALTRLADYYMGMADQIFPVVEVDAGRQIDIILTRGLQLKVKKNRSLRLANSD